MKTSNPALSIETFNGFGYVRVGDTMTIQGVIIKTALLALICVLSAGWMWMQLFKGNVESSTFSTLMTTGALGGFALGLATAFRPTWSSITAPFYALMQGLFIGGAAALLESSFPGIAIQAAMLTIGTLLSMLGCYQSGLVRPTEKFKMGVFAATGGIAFVYLTAFILSLFGIQPFFLYGSGLFSIGVSLFVVVIAALNLIIDFDTIEQSTRRGAPKYMEWYSAFALMVTLIWLYVEFLRLLSKMRSRD